MSKADWVSAVRRTDKPWGHEELFARTYHISGTCEVGLRKAWSWIREALGFGAKKMATANA